MRRQENQETLSYSKRRIEGLQSEREHMCPWSADPRPPQGVGEHRVANVDVEDQDERFQDDHCLHLLASVSAQAEQVPLVESAATRGTWVPRANKSWG